MKGHLWWIKDGGKFFDIPLVERWDPLNLG